MPAQAPKLIPKTPPTDYRPTRPALVGRYVAFAEIVALKLKGPSDGAFVGDGYYDGKLQIGRPWFCTPTNPAPDWAR